MAASSISAQQNPSNPSTNEANLTSTRTPSYIECKHVKENLTCPDGKINYRLYNHGLPYGGIQISILPNGSNSHNLRILFNPKAPVKVIIHGIILDIMTPSLVGIKDGELELTLFSFYLT